MFIGHFGVALAAKRAAPRTSLGTLFAAAQLADVVWPVLVLLGVEQVRIDPAAPNPFLRLEFVRYPFTHGALAVALWAILFGAAYRARTGYRTGALVVAALVASHWVLDFVTHRPDLPLVAGDPRVGLGLWASAAATLGVELAMFVAGAVIYARTAPPRDRAGTILLWTLLATLLAVYAASLLGPPPPSPRAIGAGALAGWPFIAWAAWVDRHRMAAGAALSRGAPTA